MTRKKKAVIPEYPKVLETFRPPGNWELNEWQKSEPSAFNGEVRFKKYRITIDEIEEPVEILQNRLEKLWLECDNIHHWEPLKKAAASIGYNFKGARGSQRPKKS